MKISYLLLGLMVSSVFIASTYASNKEKVQSIINIAQIIENTSKYDKAKVKIRTLVFLKKIEERALFPCNTTELHERKYIFLDLFTETPNNKNFVKLNAEANLKYDKYKIYDQQCVVVEGTFYKSGTNGREVGRLVLDDISPNRLTK